MSVIGFIRNLFYEQYFLSIPASTASFKHKTVIITGANSGLGKEAARIISQLDCSRLILAVRNVAAGEDARKEILAATSAPESSISVWEVDLGSFKSVIQFADRAFRELERLDVLICNAGINTPHYAEAEGFERTLTVNVLSTYLLATRLLPLLEQTAATGPVPGDPSPRPPHLSIVSSDTHLYSSFPERNESTEKMLAVVSENCKTSSSRLRIQYPTSKLLVILLVRDLVYRQKRSGPSVGINAVAKPEENCPVIINAPNPGLCRTALTREMPSMLTRLMFTIFGARSAEMGASALVNAASAGWETNAQYLSSHRVDKGGDLTWDSTLGEKLCTAVEQALMKSGSYQPKQT